MTNEEMIDRASYILLYELMIMLIQQNGVHIFFSLLKRSEGIITIQINYY